MHEPDRESDLHFLRRAVELALETEAGGNLPIAAVVVLDGEIVASGVNRTLHPSAHPGRHAEMMALAAIPDALMPRLEEMTCYTTLEPCVMCFGALVVHGMGRVVFGASDPLGGGVVLAQHLPAPVASQAVPTRWEGPTMPEVCLPLWRRAAGRYWGPQVVEAVSGTAHGQRILLVNGLEVEVRAGTTDDVPVLLSFIQSMAAYEKLTVTATEESLRATLFGDAPAARALLAFVRGEPVAYATYFFTFATMAGRRGLWLDDLFVEPAFRGRGIGRALMAYLADVAVRHDCARFEWMVLDWNAPAIAFYERLGATVLPDWRICRLEGAQLPRAADDLATGGDSD